MKKPWILHVYAGTAAVIILLSLGFLDSAQAQTADGEAVAVIRTGLGEIVVEFFPDDAPNHVSNFLDLAQAGFYDGTLFHRIIPGFMIQGGDPNTIDGAPSTWGTGGPEHSIAAEFNDIGHERGIVSMARAQHPDSAGSQFFIVHQDSAFLDGSYTVFGRIATESSFETLDKIAAVQTGPADRPADPEPVRITSMSVAERGEIPQILDLPEPARTDNAPDAMPVDSSTFESEELGISFVPPPNWLLQEPLSPDSEAPDIVAIGPTQDGETQPHIYVSVNDAHQKTLEEIVSLRLSEIREAVDDNITTLSQDDIVVAGLPATAIRATETITIDDRSFDISFMEVVFVDGDTRYTASYANTLSNFDADLPHFEKLLDTFVVTGQAEPPPAAAIKSLEDADMGPPDTDGEGDGGGCLIATAAFGSELAPQVQMLRELRDDTVLATQSGAAFMSGFNTVYYSFSPAVADLEREHPELREAVRTLITPMLASLALLAAAEIGSEAEMIMYGTAIILLNAAVYAAAPAALVYAARTVRARQRTRRAARQPGL